MASDTTSGTGSGAALAGQGSPYQKILVEVREGVAHVVLNRPERLNALDFGPGSMREEILTALAQADADPAVGAILISGAGRAFCAGGDLGKVVESQGTAAPTIEGEHAFMDMVAHFDAGVRATRKPLIAAVHGMCLGIGMSFIVQCDFVLAAEGTRFGLIEGRIGGPDLGQVSDPHRRDDRCTPRQGHRPGDVCAGSRGADPPRQRSGSAHRPHAAQQRHHEQDLHQRER